ncbi:hypothetical protein [Pseudoxanthomonas mexicana]|nr:MAG: hypothetical protein HZT39_14205 [Pseudoxanthomonas sp.]
MSKRKPKKPHRRTFQASKRPLSDMEKAFNLSIEAIRAHLTSAMAKCRHRAFWAMVTASA